jgi:hypothetical protein
MAIIITVMNSSSMEDTSESDVKGKDANYTLIKGEPRYDVSLCVCWVEIT